MVAILAIGPDCFQQFWICILPWCLQLSFWTAQSNLGLRRWCWCRVDGLCMRYSKRDFTLSSVLWYWNGTILVILNLYVTLMHPIKFQLNPTNSLVGDVVLRISRWQPSWISEQNHFSNSESLCHPQCLTTNCSSIQLAVWEQITIEIFKMLVTILDIVTKWF